MRRGFLDERNGILLGGGIIKGDFSCAGQQRVSPVTGEKEYNDDQLEFLKAVDLYKTVRRRPFPTLTELLDIIVALGYRKSKPSTFDNFLKRMR